MCPWIYLCVLCEINQRAHWCIVLDIYIYVCVCVCLYLCVLCVPATQHISLRRGLWISTALQHTATHCNTWQHTATHCTRCNSDTAHIFAQMLLDCSPVLSLLVTFRHTLSKNKQQAQRAAVRMVVKMVLKAQRQRGWKIC